MRSPQYKLGIFREEGAPGLQPAANRKWPVQSTILCAENDDVQKGKTGSKQSWGGEESPVSVIGHAARNNMSQGSHPSSGSTSMEHPVFATSPPAPPHRHPPDRSYHLSNQDSLSNDHLNLHSSSNYADFLSQQVQQAFRKSHELQTHVVKTWPTSATNKRMEWLNLQEDPPFNVGKQSKVYQYSGQSRTFAAGMSTDATQENRASSEEERHSIYSSTREADRQEDEDSVIDFFPSSTDRPSSVMQARRGSTYRIEANNGHEERRRGSLRRRSSCRGAAQHTHDENEGRVSTSHKWDDAERWLTSPATSASLTRLQPFMTNVDLQGPVKAENYTQVFQVQARKPLPDPTPTQDKHVPMNGGSHATMREAATVVDKERRSRDIATQSTPADWSRCDSPEEESAIFSTALVEKPSPSGPDYSTGADKAATTQKTSPPRHNTPARRSVSCSKDRGSRNALHSEPAHLVSGKLNMLELESCHLDKLKLARDLPLGTSSTWLLCAEDDNEKLLERKSHSSYQPQQIKLNMLEARVSAWEDVERAKHTAKFKREEAKIEAWESLQRAEADAELRKLEVKLEKMRFEGREKIMGRLGGAQRRAQEMRDAAEAQKVEQLARVAMRANQIRKSGHLPSSTFNVMCSLTTKIKPTSNLSFS